MPAHRRKQSNAMLYTLIVFVGLFIVATTVAVFYYVKAEEFRVKREELQEKMNDYASGDEQNNIGSIVGQPEGRTTYIQAMVEYLDNAVISVVGGVAESTSAQVKQNKAKTQAQDAIKKLIAAKYIEIAEPNMTGLVQVVSALTQKLQDTMDARDALKKELVNKDELHRQKEEVNLETYQKLLDDKETLRRDYDDLKIAYDENSEKLQSSTDERVQSFKEQLDREKANLKKTLDELLETQAILTETRTMLAESKEQLARYGTPSTESMAYIPDGKILSVDNSTKTVVINIGSNNRVYRGLTFSVYDKGAYIGDEKLSKAEIEIFDIGDNYATARIVKSEINKPILQNDTIANLIWDSKNVNEFVIAGDFDLNKDGSIDSDAAAKIKVIIERWGGKVTDKISVNTDFLILGTMPNIPEQRPTLEEEGIDPTTVQRYEKSLEKLNMYNELESRAKSLWVPIFTYDKFIHLIGYSGKVGQAGAF